MITAAINVQAQVNHLENRQFEDKLYNSIVKNVSFYHVLKKIDKIHDTLDTLYTASHLFNSNFRICPIPNKGQVYKISYKEEFFNDSNYSFFSYYIDPDSYYEYVEFGDSIGKTHIAEPIKSNVPVFFLYNELQRSGLVACKKGKGFLHDPLFFSGELFLDDIKSILFGGEITTENIYSYIAIRYFSYYPEKIKCKTKYKDFSCYFYSNTLNKDVSIGIYKAKKEDKISILK